MTKSAKKKTEEIQTIKTEADFDTLSLKERLNSFLTGYAYFSSVHTPNMMKNSKYKEKPKWSIKLGLEGSELKKAEKMGLTIYQPTDSIPYKHVEIKRNARDEDIPELGLEGALNKVKPEVFDTKQVPIPPEILIGNGSLVRVKFTRYWHGNVQNDDKKSGPGVGTALLKVQVRKLVEYNPTEAEFEVDEEEEGSFTVDTGSSYVNKDSDYKEPPFDLDEEDSVDDIFDDEE